MIFKVLDLLKFVLCGRYNYDYSQKQRNTDETKCHIILT